MSEVLTLGDVADIVAGVGFPKDMQGGQDGAIPVFKVGDISAAWLQGKSLLNDSRNYLSAEEAKSLGKCVPAGATVFAKIGEALRLNRRVMLGRDALVDNNVMGLVPKRERVAPKYLYYFMQTVDLGELSRSTTVPSIRKSDVVEISIPVPAIAVQDEIVAELEKQFSRLDEAVANLQRVKANLKRYRASVLNDAVEGRLVECDSPVELVKLGSVANLIDPQPSHRTPPTHPDGVPYIGIGDVLENGKLDFQNSRKVSPTVLEEHRARYTLRIGDFIFGKIGTLGRPTLLMPPFTYTLSANVVLVQADGVRLLPEYALIFMDSPKLLNMISREAKATTQAAYGIKRMRDLEINLPPVEQQRKIVAEVDRHLSIIREVEAEVDANLQRARALRQSTLSSVFSGG